VFHSSLISNVNTLWGATIAETLARLGLQYAVISPGSGSSALALGFYGHPKLKSTVILDERVAAFYALGLVKASDKPVALVCTSGTACAHYYPAVIEAKMSGMPLILLSADRAPQDQACQAEQVIDQYKIYQSMPVWQQQLSLPQINLSLFQSLRDQIVQAYRYAACAQAGPVHLNVPFEYPPLGSTPPFLDQSFKDLLKIVNQPSFFASVEVPIPVASYLTDEAAQRLWSTLSGCKRGLITVGYPMGLGRQQYVQEVALLSRYLGWPILADAIATSVRGQATCMPGLVDHYADLVQHPTVLDRLKPEMVLQIGRLPTNKKLRDWLASLNVPTYLIDPRLEAKDPLFRSQKHYLTTPSALIQQLKVEPVELTDYALDWVHQASQFNQSIDDQLTESTVPQLLSQYLPKGTPLVVSNSRPIRHFEAHFAVGDHQLDVYANRGANGIDGLIATAMGVATVTQKPTVLVIGDLAFLHDHAALLLHQNGFKGSLTIVCLDNGGGGIFRDVPSLQGLAQHEWFDQLWLTPQTADIPSLAQAYRMPVHKPTHTNDFIAYLEKLPQTGTQLIYLQL